MWRAFAQGAGSGTGTCSKFTRDLRRILGKLKAGSFGAGSARRTKVRRRNCRRPNRMSCCASARRNSAELAFARVRP